MGKNSSIRINKMERSENSLYHTIRDYEIVQPRASQRVENGEKWIIYPEEWKMRTIKRILEHGKAVKLY
jgi:hypothetical protein